MGIEIIVGTPFSVNTIIFSVQGTLEALVIFLGISKRESVILYTIVHIFSSLLYVSVHYPITSSILAFQLPLA